MDKYFDMAINFGTKVLICIIILIISSFIVKFIRNIISKSISRKRLDERKANTLGNIFYSICKYAVYFIAICQILKLFGVDMTSIIAVAGIGSIAIGLGAQSFVQDVISGMFILTEDRFGVGDLVDIDGNTGTVERITITSTYLRTVTGELFIIPNGLIKIVQNKSKDYSVASVTLATSYEADTDKIIAVLKDEVERIFKNKEIAGLMDVPNVLGITNLGESSVDIGIAANCEVGTKLNVERELRRFIKNRFDRDNIEFTYNKTVVFLKKGDE